MTKYANKEPEDKRELYNKDVNVNIELDKAAELTFGLKNIEAGAARVGLLGSGSGNIDEKNTTWYNSQIDPTPDEKPITRDEALDYITKRMDSHIFIERNCSSLMNEDQIIRLSKIKEYIVENLK